MVARDHLADQPEREELQPDHDQQHTEHQQGAVSDRVAEGLQHRQVDQDRRPEESEDQPEAAEEVQRPVPVAADERHGQEVEETAQVALDAVPRPAVLAWAVVHGKLGDAEAAVVREHRDEAV
jgi:hypothetical protein